jgi:N-acetyl-gamma-glutamyl-phosphate reductase
LDKLTRLCGVAQPRHLVCYPLSLEELTPLGVDVVFLATPHEISHEVVSMLLDRGLRVIDLSGAFRLKKAGAYTHWYNFEHRAPAALSEAVYGLPEVNGSEIRRAQLVANPGCYATSIILALAPLTRAGWIDLEAGMICDSKSGASGAGRAPSDNLHFVEVNENCRAYNLFRHRHLPEMMQALGLEESQLTFVPHLLPINRGILSTIYVRLIVPRTAHDVLALYHGFYASAPLVRVYGDGSLPQILAVAFTSYADIGFALDPATRSTRLVLVSALDNLGKGAAGQAIQNMNLMFGFAEQAGLM